MYSWRVLEGPTRSRRGLSGERSLASRRVAKATLFAGEARSHKARSGQTICDQLRAFSRTSLQASLS